MAKALAQFILAVLALSGCGTLYNLEESEGRIYGGVRADLAMSGICVLGAAQENQGAWERTYALALATSILAVDLPLSAAGDTLTLPLTCLATYQRLTGPRPHDSEAKVVVREGPPNPVTPPTPSGTEQRAQEPPSAGQQPQPVNQGPR
jgi:uncharacterized protein YceK